MDHRDEPGWIRIEGKEMESVLEVRTYDRTTIKLLVRPGVLNGIFVDFAFYFYPIYVVFYPNSFIVVVVFSHGTIHIHWELSLVFVIYSSTVF